MKDENIKEILEDIKEIYYFKPLLDYITNLQTIEQQYSAILSENAELENKITNLQEEINKLTAESTEWESKCYDLQEESKELKKKITFNEKSRRKMQQSLVGQIEDYKTRIDKTIEKLKKYGNGTFDDDLLKTLQGKSDE